ncbi:MAG TPA: AAA family ATPase, partial [Polyangiales bacterium]
MRILRLDLVAFGPFTGGRLDFAKKPGALQLVYGPNEAGKSTTLRALLALLYGIPVRTSDAHLHEMTRLRVGALLEDHRGRLLQLTRRKGAKHTLLDDKGEPVDDGALGEMLLGIDESMFRQMFGLDHQRLREGGEALLAGGGNLGEGLFDASVGTRALRQLKEALKAEAELLYKARGKTPKLNLALDVLREK